MASNEKARGGGWGRSVWRAWLDYGRGPIALIPCLAFLLIIQAYSELGQWGPRQLLALSLGMTGSMMVAGGFTPAVSRRMSIFLSMGNREAALHFFRVSTAAVGGAIVVPAALAVLLAVAVGRLEPMDGLLLGLAFVGVSWISLVAVGLIVVDSQVWLGVGLVAGLAGGAVIDHLAQPWTEAHLALATGAGFSIALGTILYVLRRRLGPGLTASPPHLTLPPLSYLIDEAAPFFAYGSLAVVFVLIPHLLGWVGPPEAGQGRWQAVGGLEAALILSMPPVILGGGVVERAVRLFWGALPAALEGIVGHDPSAFRRRFIALHRSQLRRYLIVLTGLSLVAYGAFRAAMESGWLAAVAGLAGASSLETMFAAGLLGYWLLGWGLFNAMHCVSLGQPGPALRAVTAGILAMLVAGLPLSLGLGYQYAVAGLIVGGSAFAVAAQRASAELLDSLDYVVYCFS